METFSLGTTIVTNVLREVLSVTLTHFHKYVI